MNNESEKQIGYYDTWNVPFLGLNFCALIFAVIGIFSFTLRNTPTTATNADGSTNSFYFDTSSGLGDPKTLFLTISIILIVIAIIMCWFAFTIKSKHNTFVLFENKIVIQNKGKEISSLLFSNIEDVYLFSVGRRSYTGNINSLAFRKDSNAQWFIISPMINRNGALIKKFRELHTQHRALILSEQLFQRNDTLKISYIDGSSVWFKRATALRLKDFVNFESSLKSFSLSKEFIEIEGNRITIEATDSLSTNSWIENLYLSDKDGKQKFSKMFSSILSADVLVAVLHEVIQHKQQQDI